MSEPIRLETERLILRKFARADIEDLHAQLSDPEVMRYYSHPSSREESEKWLEGILRDYETNGFGMLAVCLKKTGEYAGQAGVVRRQIDGRERHYLAYLIRKGLWGNGYATESARKVLEYAFDDLGIEKVEALIRPDNIASVRIAEKLGMKVEPAAEYHMGHEHRVYGLTR